MAIETQAFDAGEFLTNEKTMRHYLEAAFEDGDPAVICAAFGSVAKARGMTALARESGVTREALYRAFSESGNLTLDTLLKVTKALGVRLSIVA